MNDIIEEEKGNKKECLLDIRNCIYQSIAYIVVFKSGMRELYRTN